MTTENNDQKTFMSTDVGSQVIPNTQKPEVLLSSQSPIEAPKTAEQLMADDMAKLRKSIENLSTLEKLIPTLKRPSNVQTAIRYASTLLQVTQIKESRGIAATGDPADVTKILPENLSHIDVHAEQMKIDKKESDLSANERTLITLLYNIYVKRTLAVICNCAIPGSIDSKEHAADIAKELSDKLQEAITEDNQPVMSQRASDISKSIHDSDCATNNEPASPNGPCNCSLAEMPSEPEVK